MVKMINFMLPVFYHNLKHWEEKHNKVLSVSMRLAPLRFWPCFWMQKEMSDYLPHSTSVKRGIALPSILLGLKQNLHGVLGSLNNKGPSFTLLKLHSLKKPLFSSSLETNLGGILHFPVCTCSAQLFQANLRHP